MSNYSRHSEAGCVSAGWRSNPTHLSRSYYPFQVHNNQQKQIDTSCLYWNKWWNEVMSVAPYLILFAQSITLHYATCSQISSTYSLNLSTLLDFSLIYYFTSSRVPFFSRMIYFHTYSPHLICQIIPFPFTHSIFISPFLPPVISVVEGENSKWGWEEAASQAERAQPHRGEAGLHSASVGCG